MDPPGSIQEQAKEWEAARKASKAKDRKFKTRVTRTCMSDSERDLTRPTKDKTLWHCLTCGNDVMYVGRVAI